MAHRDAHKNFIGGRWVDAAEGGTMEVLNPATGETIAEVPSCTAADVDARSRRRRRRCPSGSTRRPASVPSVLLKLADVLDANAEELAEIESRNVGKPLVATRATRCPSAPTTCASSPAPRGSSRAARPASTCGATRR